MSKIAIGMECRPILTYFFQTIVLILNKIMKCSVCEKTLCLCAAGGTIFPMKSTLSPSVTELPQDRLKRKAKQNYEQTFAKLDSANLRRSSESIEHKHGFDSKKEKFVYNSHQRGRLGLRSEVPTHSPINISSSLTLSRSRTCHPSFLPYQEYLKQEEIRDCSMCKNFSNLKPSGESDQVG